MKVTLLCIGKTDFDFVEKGLQLYNNRLQHYCKFSIVCVPAIKGAQALTKKQVKEREGGLLLKELVRRGAYVVLLDERGARYSSLEWAAHLEKVMGGAASGKGEICFVTGGAYGFSEEVYGIADEKLSLSQMTLSHQIVRLFFAEQLYRAFTIIKGEPYHHE